MRLSAVVVSYRTGAILFDCLDALAADADIADIVIVDNGNSPEAESQIDAFAATHDQVRVLRGHGNIGFARASNLGARAAQGDLVLFVNPDVVVGQGAAGRMAATFPALPAPAIVGGDLRTAQGRPDRGSRRDRVTYWRALITYSGLSRLGRWIAACRDLHRHEDPLPTQAAKVGVVSGALFMMRRSDFHAIGGFDENYFLHFEDVDLCRRVDEASGAVLFQPGAVGVHMRSSSDAPAAQITRHKVRGLTLYLRKVAQTPLERLVAHAMHGAARIFLPV